LTTTADNNVMEKNAPARNERADTQSTAAARPPQSALRVQTEYSRGLGQWLISNQIGLVSSAYLTGYLLFLGVRADGMPIASAANFSLAMGIAASRDRIYVGTKNEIWRLENVLRSDELANDLFDRFYVPRTAELTGDVNIHELGIDADGKVIFVNTRYSCLAAISPTHSFKPIWKPKFISRLAPEDRCHLNGLAMEGGRPRYVTACSTGDLMESWRGRQRDGGVIIDIDTDNIVADGLSMPHSPRVWDDAIYVLESGRGYLVRIDRHSGKRDDIAFCPGFARGLAFVPGYALVTISRPRRGTFAGLPIEDTLRANGAGPRCGLLVIDLRNGDIVQWFRLHGDIAELFDVGIIENVRCPRGIGPFAPALEEVMRGEELCNNEAKVALSTQDEHAIGVAGKKRASRK
jgi:uncharacterized protein (TIGR03032 family)